MEEIYGMALATLVSVLSGILEQKLERLPNSTIRFKSLNMLFSLHFLLGLICVDKRRACPDYAAQGDCITNGWTESNCRISCRSKCDTYPIKPNGNNQITASLCYQTLKSSMKVSFEYLYWCFTP